MDDRVSRVAFREELTFQDGIIFKGERIVVPQSVRNDMLSRIHNGHVGIQDCLRRAKESLYWPRMYRDIENFVRNCESCKSISFRTDCGTTIRSPLNIIPS
jgi:hypothetical protein